MLPVIFMTAQETKPRRRFSIRTRIYDRMTRAGPVPRGSTLGHSPHWTAQDCAKCNRRKLN